MCFIQTQDLLAQRENVGAVRIQHGFGEIVAIVNGVNRRQGISRRKQVVQPNRAQVLTNRLQRAAEEFGDSARCGRGRARRDGGLRPQIQQGLDGGSGIGARCVVRNKCDGGLMQVLAQSFVIAEQESSSVRSGPPSAAPN